MAVSKSQMFMTWVLLMMCVVVSSNGELPELGMTVPELIRYWNYPVEEHHIRTDDGYLLTVHRIPHGRHNNNTTSGKDRPVVFLQHGLLCSSSNWVINLPHQSFAFILADNGFDVFLGNVRGNTYSRRHEHLKTSSPRFWDFSFDEHAKYDLPAMINHALNVTGREQLYYVGHSQGTMMAFAKLSEDEQFQKKIKMFFALAPVAKLRHVYGPFELLARFELTFKFVFKLLQVYDFMPSSKSIEWFIQTLCPLQPHLCHRITYFTSSYGLQNFNKTRKPIILDHTPAGTSVKNMYHFMQLVQEEQFQKYDYGFLGNVNRYGTYYPPTYDLSQVKNKILIMYGTQDWLTHPKDVRWLSRQLPNVVETMKVKGYNHLDFVWGLDARDQIYEKIIKVMMKEEGEQGR